MQKNTNLLAMPQKPPFPVRLPDDIERPLKAIAEADDRKLHYIILKACKEFVDREYPKLKKKNNG